MKIIVKVILNVAHHGDIMPKIAVNNIFFTFLFYWITSDLHLHQKTFIKKNYIEELCKNHLKMNYVEYPIHTQKDYPCFNKKSTSQTFIFISSASKVVYPLPHVKYSMAPLGDKVLTSKVLYGPPDT